MCHYIRNSGAHGESSGSIVFLLNNISTGDVLSLTTVREGLNGIMNDDEPALLTIWNRAE